MGRCSGNDNWKSAPLPCRDVTRRIFWGHEKGKYSTGDISI